MHSSGRFYCHTGCCALQCNLTSARLQLHATLPDSMCWHLTSPCNRQTLAPFLFEYAWQQSFCFCICACRESASCWLPQQCLGLLSHAYTLVLQEDAGCRLLLFTAGLP